MKDILDLTYIQFKNIIEGIGHRINFDIRLSYSSISEKAIETNEIPLFIKDSRIENGKFTMADALKIQSLAQG